MSDQEDQFLIQDSFGLEIPKLVPEKLKVLDAAYRDSNGPQDLFIKMKATHGGIVNGNKVLYVPYRQRDSLHTFTQPYPKPFLSRHFRPMEESSNEAIGRVADAGFVDLSDNYKMVTQDSLNSVNGLMQDNGANRMYKGIQKMMKYGLLADKSWEGLSYVELLVRVIDPDAIQKIVDGRYLTVSTSQATDDMVCWHCKRSLKSGGCDHPRGKVYQDDDGNEYPNFYIFGNFDYRRYRS